MKQSKLFWAWLAGFYEGEGSLVIDKYGLLQLYLYQKELQVLKLIRRRIGGRLTNPIVDKSTGRRVARLRWNSLESLELIRKLLPFMKSKRRIIQVRKALRRNQ